MGEISLFKAIIRSRYPEDSEVCSLVDRLSFIQNSIMQMRMQRIDVELQKYHRVVSALAEPMIHLLRNSADHGIESPAERVEQGKPVQGTIRLSAFQASGNVVIEIHNDGRGIEPEKMRRALVAKKLCPKAEARSLNDTQAIQQMFRPGFSTRNRVTELSGRGVGMDSVKSAIEAAGGAISVDSFPGRGTPFRARFPLS